MNLSRYGAKSWCCVPCCSARVVRCCCLLWPRNGVSIQTNIYSFSQYSCRGQGGGNTVKKNECSFPCRFAFWEPQKWL